MFCHAHHYECTYRDLIGRQEVHIKICIYINVCVCVCVCMHICACVHTCAHACVFKSEQTNHVY